MGFMGSFGRRLGAHTALFLAFARLAAPCGDATLPGTATENAQLAIQAGTTVHIGQAIGASLILPKDSKLETGTLGRTGCTPFHFTVAPETGWHDSWADWYYSGIPKHASAVDRPYQSTCGVSGGAAAIRLADGTIIRQPAPPRQVGFNLTDWLEFDKPGKYTISLTYRVRVPNGQGETWNEEAPPSFVTLQTDPIEIEVLPESPEASANAAKELAAYITYLDASKPATANSDSPRYPYKAVYSQSPLVIHQIVQFFIHAWSDQAALLNYPDQEHVLEELESQLREPRNPISTDYLDLLAFTKTRLQHPELFGERIHNQWTNQWEADSKLRNTAFLQNVSEYTKELLAATPRKEEKAQGDCLKTVLQILAHWPLPKEEVLRKRAAWESAKLLSKMSKPPLLGEDDWRVIASPSMIPFLMRSLREGLGFGDENQRWLYEVAPLRVQRLMISAMEQGHWSLALSWGHVVQPNLKISRLVDDYAINVFTDYDDDYDNSDLEWILLKFGTRVAAPSARKVLASQECLGDPMLWGFLLKVDGARTEQDLVQRFHKAKVDKGCRADSAVLRVLDVLDGPQERTWEPYWSHAIEGIAVSELANESTFLASQAAQLLGLYGSKNVEDKLWKKLEAWHRSPPLEPDGHPDLSSVETPAWLEQTLIAALLGGRGWSTHEHMGRVWSLCVYTCDMMKLKQYQAHAHRLGPVDWPRNTAYIDYTADSPAFSKYAFREWLERFPPGAKFAVLGWRLAEMPAAEVQEKDPELWQVLKKMKFEVVGPPEGFDEYGRCLAGQKN